MTDSKGNAMDEPQWVFVLWCSWAYGAELAGIYPTRAQAAGAREALIGTTPEHARFPLVGPQLTVEALALGRAYPADGAR